MKIRSYKGHSLEKIYEVVEKELGPEAVVVSTKKPQGMKGLLPSFLGGDLYELIAVADDLSADRQVLNTAGGFDEVRHLSRLQAEKWKQMEQTVQELRSDIRSMSRSQVTFADGIDAGLPEFARGWDPRFTKAVREKSAGFFEKDTTAARREVVGSLLRVEDHFSAAAKQRPHIVVLVGPTGSGKTTTLAKLASRWALDEHLKVGLITTDTFRVAAVDQIREYATLLGLELRVAFSASEAARAAKSFEDRDVILVDTAGRNHYDQASLMGLRGILQGMGTVTVLLMVPATLERSQVTEMVRNFQILNPNYLVITKVDETRRYDLFTIAASETAHPVAFLTDGQRVPQDIRAARADDLAALLVPEEK